MVIDMQLVGDFIFLMLKNAAPLIFASCGEVISERSGIINLGVEGSMLVGALVGVIATLTTGNVWVGIAVGGVAGSLIALIHGFITAVLGGNQIVSGIAVTMMGMGLTSLVGRGYVGRSLLGLRPKPVYPLDVPGPYEIKPLVAAFIKQDAVVYASIILPFLITLLLFKTKLGTAMRACGENPIIAESLGVNVVLTRLLAVILGGFLAGIGGAYLSLGVVGTWVENVTAGIGWIAVGLVAFGMWMPVRTSLASYLIAGLIALAYILQGRLGISSYFLIMIPYITTIAVLAITNIERLRIKLGAPAALGKPYIREERLG